MTAVEWLVDQLDLNVFESDEEAQDVIAEAKAMDKEKLKDAYDAGVWDVGCRAVNFDEYYKRTFKSK